MVRRQVAGVGLEGGAGMKRLAPNPSAAEASRMKRLRAALVETIDAQDRAAAKAERAAKRKVREASATGRKPDRAPCGARPAGGAAGVAGEQPREAKEPKNG